jgi:calcineurin-like phosphoesterase family protein
MGVFFISDTHFDDKNILIYSRPEFSSLEEMNKKIVENWNKTIKENDIVYLLGDIGNYEYLKQLNGKIIVVLGNHDNYDKLVKVMPNIKIYDRPIIEKYMFLSHEPISFLSKEIPYLNIHGHTHQFDYRMGTSMNWYDGNRYFNVSCEKINYTPISLDEIIKIIGYEQI